MQRYLSTTQRNVIWFKRAFENGELDIRAPFQRNPVWSVRQKSSLIDTILMEYPIPELYMQELVEESGEQKHVVVDGQQRVRAVLSFLEGEFEIDDENSQWAGFSFDDLSGEVRKKFFEYNFIVRQLPEMPDEQLRLIFQRINRNTVTLNQQELRKATYWGPFLRLMEDLADLDFWTNAGIFSANDRRRMLDVEFISELSVAFLNGLQNKKKNLEQFYQQYETSFEDSEKLRSVFTKVLGEIEQLVPDMRRTRWRKKSDFYTLFLTLAGRAAALPLSANDRDLATKVLASFAEDVDAALSGNVPTDADVRDYAKYVERAASDLGSRRARQGALHNKLATVLK